MGARVQHLPAADLTVRLRVRVRSGQPFRYLRTTRIEDVLVPAGGKRSHWKPSRVTSRSRADQPRTAFISSGPVVQKAPRAGALTGGNDASRSRNRPRHHQLRDRGDGGRPADRDTERGGIADDSLGGGLYAARRAPGGADRPAAGDPEPEGDDLLREAVHRAA